MEEIQSCIFKSVVAPPGVTVALTFSMTAAVHSRISKLGLEKNNLSETKRKKNKQTNEWTTYAPIGFPNAESELFF